jgi:hypothetical protein
MPDSNYLHFKNILKLAKIWIGANLAKVGESGEGSFPDEKADFLRSRRLPFNK